MHPTVPASCIRGGCRLRWRRARDLGALVVFSAAAASVVQVAGQLPGTPHNFAEGLGPRWTLVGEDGNQKTLVPSPVADLLTPNETRSINEYDRIFEKYSMYCNGRWLGAQVLQDAQDLMYLQHLLFATRPAVIVETGTYKGGLTYFFATIMDALGLEGKILSIDRNPVERVHDASWFCPVCESCIRVWETNVWRQRVEFFAGWADDRDLYKRVRQRVAELDGPVLVNLDACHEHDCVFVEIMLYAPLVSVGSFLVVQDVKLDKLWGKPAVHSAVQKFLQSSPDFVRDRTLEFYGYTQHVYLRRVRATMEVPNVDDSGGL